MKLKFGGSFLVAAVAARHQLYQPLDLIYMRGSKRTNRMSVTADDSFSRYSEFYLVREGSKTIG